MSLERLEVIDRFYDMFDSSRRVGCGDMGLVEFVCGVYLGSQWAVPGTA